MISYGQDVFVRGQAEYVGRLFLFWPIPSWYAYFPIHGPIIYLSSIIALQQPHEAPQTRWLNRCKLELVGSRTALSTLRSYNPTSRMMCVIFNLLHIPIFMSLSLCLIHILSMRMSYSEVESILDYVKPYTLKLSRAKSPGTGHGLRSDGRVVF